MTAKTGELERYERYCHENRGYRMSREEFYRDRW